MSTFELVPMNEKGTISAIKAKERINLGNTDELMKIAASAQERGARSLLLDLSDTPSITSAGLRCIVSIYKLFGGAGAFKLVSPSQDVRRTLEIAGMADRIQIYDDVPTAVASFQ